VSQRVVFGRRGRKPTPGTLTATNRGAQAVAAENIDESSEQSSAAPETTLQVRA
jgi:hypothetical protein